MNKSIPASISLMIITLFLTNLIIGCETKEIAPFKDGDSLEYKRIAGGPASITYIYRIAKEKGKRFTVTWGSKRDMADGETTTVVIDGTGKIVETPFPEGSLGKDLFDGRQIKLWLAPVKRKVGERIYFADFIAKHQITKETKWKLWDVWVSRHSNVFGWYEMYFDKQTGFLVGHKSATGDIFVLGANTVGLSY